MTLPDVNPATQLTAASDVILNKRRKALLGLQDNFLPRDMRSFHPQDGDSYLKVREDIRGGKYRETLNDLCLLKMRSSGIIKDGIPSKLAY